MFSCRMFETRFLETRTRRMQQAVIPATTQTTTKGTPMEVQNAKMSCADQLESVHHVCFIAGRRVTRGKAESLSHSLKLCPFTTSTALPAFHTAMSDPFSSGAVLFANRAFCTEKEATTAEWRSRAPPNPALAVHRSKWARWRANDE
ncbi:hypothetical protein BLNAU_11317 [Blattamonas nauphoetae]|uniref:Uncharacterized protein n=1 Tax=Blattamonas nauphoetae TaxID=2049346 RepID=A0ABQ9XR62_9EUKA|nr:hypothetical protein BLNAU_11317 [Blattamonas nauphoetae]